MWGNSSSNRRDDQIFDLNKETQNKGLKNGSCYKKVKVPVKLVAVLNNCSNNSICRKIWYRWWRYLSKFQKSFLILRNFISLFWDFNRGSTRKEHLQMLVLKSKEKMMERWKRTPFSVTKSVVHHRRFYWPSSQISKQRF